MIELIEQLFQQAKSNKGVAPNYLVVDIYTYNELGKEFYNLHGTSEVNIFQSGNKMKMESGEEIKIVIGYEETMLNITFR